MAFRILIAAGNPDYLKSLRELADAARAFLPIRLEVIEACSIDETRQRLADAAPDALMADWSLVPENTLGAVRALLAEQPDLRVLLLLPDVRREYREAAWGVGACACVPRDRIDPEWLQAMLCVMNRAKEREARLRRGAA
jgi:DNA-binding NarL/FixJ family response regulator